MAAEQNIYIQGPVGKLEARWQATARTDVGLIMCHPHPLFQGTMHNKVVTTVTRAASALNIPTLRFNFRGVEGSEGGHDHGRGEQDDVLAALTYVVEHLGWRRVLLAGFSFGAGMACLAACRQPEAIAGLWLLAPPVHHFDAPDQLPYGFESHIYFGDADEVVPVDDMQSWAERVIPTPAVLLFTGGTHFFHGRLIELKQALQEDFRAVLA